jgi:hypothetical protein
MTNNKKALLIGIDYRGSNNELLGCVDDIFKVKKYLIDKHKFTNNDIVMLADFNCQNFPNKNNILDAITKLCKDNSTGTQLYLHYIGHSYRSYNQLLEEKTFYNYLMIPSDADLNNNSTFISNNEIKNIICNLPSDVKLSCVFDCCYDLNGFTQEITYNYNSKETNHDLQINVDINNNTVENIFINYCVLNSFL